MLAQVPRQRVHARDGELNFSLPIRAWTHSNRRIPHEPAKSQRQSDRDSFPVGHGPPPFGGGRTQEARQARCRLGAPQLCWGGHYSDAGGVSSLPRDFLLKNQKASMIRATIKPILKTRKNNGRRKAAASFHSTTPTRPTAASCTTGFSISESGTRDVEQYAIGGQKCRGLALKYTIPPPA